MNKVHQPGLAMPAQLAIDSDGKVYGVIGPDGKVYGLGLGGNLVNYDQASKRMLVGGVDQSVAVGQLTSVTYNATTGLVDSYDVDGETYSLTYNSNGQVTNISGGGISTTIAYSGNNVSSVTTESV